MFDKSEREKEIKQEKGKTRFDAFHLSCTIEVIDHCLFLGLRPFAGLSQNHVAITGVAEFGEIRAPRARPRLCRRFFFVASELRYNGGTCALNSIC